MINKYCIVVFFLTFISFASPKNFPVSEKDKKEKREKKKENHLSHLKIKKKKGNYGVEDEKNKKIIVPFIYKKILPINEEGFAAKKEDNWILYTTEGELIPLPYAFEKINIPAEIDGENKIVLLGKERKKESKVIAVIKNGSRYYYNSYDNIQAISPSYYHITKNSLRGTLTATGKEIIPPIYKNIYYLKPSKKGEPYIAKVQNEYTGLIDLSTGEVLVSVKWKDVEILSSELFKVYADRKWGIVNSKDTLVIPIEYDRITALSPKFIKVENSSETFFISLDSPSNTHTQLTHNFSDSLQITQKNKKFGVVDASQNLIIPFGYTYITETPQQVFIVSKNKKYKLINYSGKDITPYYKHLEYDSFTQNFLVENKKGKWCILNYKGEILLETKFSKKDKLLVFLHERPQTVYERKTIKGRGAPDWLAGVGSFLLNGFGEIFFYILTYTIATMFELIFT